MHKVTLFNSKGAEEGIIMGPAVNAAAGDSIPYDAAANISTEIVGDFVDVTCTTDAFIRITPIQSVVDADNTGYYVTGGLTYRFPLPQSGLTVSAVKVTSAGTLYVHPVS